MDFLHEKRREFVERHAPLLRMKPTEMQMPMAMLTKWLGLAELVENEANEKAMNSQQADAVACEQLISLLLAESQPANAYECFCIALLVTRQFHLFRHDKSQKPKATIPSLSLLAFSTSWPTVSGLKFVGDTFWTKMLMRVPLLRTRTMTKQSRICPN